MKEIHDNGGIRLTLDFGSGRKPDVIAIHAIQFIICDCKANDLLCDRKGGHSLNMKGLCRDCNAKPSDSDGTLIWEYLDCTFHKLGNIIGRTKEQLDKYSFLLINNYFHSISFRGCDRNLYVATPAEILHPVLLELCEYIAEGMEMTFTTSATVLTSDVTMGMYENSRWQSERNLPDLGTFRHGLMSVK